MRAQIESGIYLHLYSTYNQHKKLNILTRSPSQTATATDAAEFASTQILLQENE